LANTRLRAATASAPFCNPKFAVVAKKARLGPGGNDNRAYAALLRSVIWRKAAKRNRITC